MIPSTFITILNKLSKSVTNDSDGLILFNLVAKDIANRSNWRELQKTQTYSVTGATANTLPTDFKNVEEMLVDSNAYARSKYEDRARYPVNSKPGVYYLYGGSFYLPGYTSPGASNNVVLSYGAQWTDLTSVTATSLFGPAFDPIFTDLGLAYFWQGEGNYGKASNHLALAENKMTELIGINNKPVRGEARRVQHISEKYPRTF